MSDHVKQQPPARPQRAARLAAALRANLKRRKAQARGRAEAPEQGAIEKDRPNRRNSDPSDR